MKLSGQYSHEELARALQGNFSCQQVLNNSKGEPLGVDEHITLELFFLKVDIYPHKEQVVISKVSEDSYGQKTAEELVTLESK
jgi:hypothetical protein